MRTALVLGLLALAPLARAADFEKLLEKRTFKKGGSSLLYRLMKPDGYDGKKAYPLVIFLHGAGERGKDNEAQLRHGIKDFASDDARKKYPCFLIAPQCPSGGFWSNIDFRARPLKMGKEPSPSGQLVLDLLASMRKEFKVDEKRIYITGLSMGGFGTWDLMCRHPNLFAAGIPICGGADTAAVVKIAKVPVWAFHGDKDRAVNVSLTRDAIAAMKKAGGSPKYTEYPGAGHDSWTKTYSDPKVMKWLFEQKKKD
jgi:predicted peptidase